MIFVTLGTFLSPFTRPLVALEKLCEMKIITEDVIVQNGHTNFESKYMQMKGLITPKQMREYLEDARIVITHAGTGSLVQPVKMSKKVIAIARLFELDEHVDDHQLDIFGKFVEFKYVYPWYLTDSLQQILIDVENFEPNQFVSTKDKVVKYLEDYIDHL